MRLWRRKKAVSDDPTDLAETKTRSAAPAEKRKSADVGISIRLERDGKVIYESEASELVLPLKIGRKVADGWRLPADDMTASGNHAEIYFRLGVLRLRDVGSRNGLVFKGARVKEVKLVPGVKVAIGTSRLIVEKSGGAKAKSRNPYHRLELQTGKFAGKFYDLKDETTLVGSEVGDGIQCRSMLVSRRHAEIICKSDGSCWVKDVGSSNGTRVNGEDLEKGKERILHHRDVVAFADCEFRFWDKTKEPPFLFLKKLGVAAATSAVCFLGYVLFNAVMPSAARLLRIEEAYEREEKFATALAMLEKVPDARGGGTYLSEIERRRANIALWQDTLERWAKITEVFSRRRWVPASKELGALLADNVNRWDWNTTTAQEEKRKARMMKNLLDVFLSARTALGGGFASQDEGREIEILTQHVAAMEKALANPEWDASLPTGPLRDDMAEQIDAVKAVVGDLMELRRLIACISAPKSPWIADVVGCAADFERIAADLEKMAADSDARNTKRREAAEQCGRKFVASDIVKDKCLAYMPVLRQFVLTRQALEANCENLVSLKYDALASKLPEPSDAQVDILPMFGDIRQVMAAANKRIVQDLSRTVKDQTGRLTFLGVTPGAMPECVQKLLDEQRMSSVFACDTLNANSYPPSPVRKTRNGAYDEVLGVEEFGAFLSQVDFELDYSFMDGIERPEPLLVESVKVFSQVDMFTRSCANPDVAFLLRLAPPDGNRLQEFAALAVKISEMRSLLIDEWWNREGANPREDVIAHGAALALDAGKSLSENDVNDFRTQFVAWKTQIKRLDDRLKNNPTLVGELRPQILAIGIPNVSTGRTMRHWVDEARAKEGR